MTTLEQFKQYAYSNDISFGSEKRATAAAILVLADAMNALAIALANIPDTPFDPTLDTSDPVDRF